MTPTARDKQHTWDKLRTQFFMCSEEGCKLMLSVASIDPEKSAREDHWTRQEDGKWRCPRHLA